MIAPRCPPHATAPSRALRPKIRLQPPSLRIPHRKRSQWCPRARKGQEHTVGLLYLPRYGRACLTRRPWNPETTETAPSSPSNTDRQPDLASHSLTKTVSKSLLTSLMVRLNWYNKWYDDANSFSFFSVSWRSQDGPFCEVRPSCSDGQRWLYNFLQLCIFEKCKIN